MSTGEALGVAVVSRMVFTSADVLAAGVATLSATRLLGRRRADAVKDDQLSAAPPVPGTS
jgi:hypothetical protein